MELTNDFRVPVPVDEAWHVLTDVERIAPCMPGAQLQEVEGEEYRGIVKVKVGPITAQYKGAAHFVERDDAAHRAVLRAEGRDTRGQGNAAATITAQLSADGDGTAVSVHTDLTVTGKVAQFGRGVLADVSAKLLGQFVECLESTVLADGADGDGDGGAEGTAAAVIDSGTDVPSTRAVDAAAEAAAPPPPPAAEVGSAPAAPEVRRIEGPEARPVDLLDAAGTPLAKRVVPLLAALLSLWLLRRYLRRRRG